MSLSKRLVAGATAVALGMGVMLVGGASPAGAAVVSTESTQWIWCNPTPLDTQKQAVPTVTQAPDSVSAGDTFDVSFSTQLPSIVLNGFIIYDSDTLWQFPEEVTVNSVELVGGTSGDPAFNDGQESQWAGEVWINPTIEDIEAVNTWFAGATAIENPYPEREPGTPSEFGPIPPAVPEGWEPNENTVLVQSTPNPGLTSSLDSDWPEQLGFAGRPTPQTVVANVTVKEGVDDQWINWGAPLTSHSHAYAANFGLSTDTTCIPHYCEPGVPPAECSALPAPGQPLSQLKMTARYILGQTAVGDAFPDFLDVPRWAHFYDEIFWMGDTGISEGYPVPGGYNYQPNDALTRQAMSAFLFRQANPGVEPTACTEMPFVDVPVDHPFCAEIKWMSDEGISTGYDTPEGKKYQPNTPLTRMAMSAFLFRLGEGGEADPPDCAPPIFIDVQPGDDFCGEIKWMALEGISEGYETSGGMEYRPALPLTRQAMSAFLFRFSEIDL